MTTANSFTAQSGASAPPPSGQPDGPAWSAPPQPAPLLPARLPLLRPRRGRVLCGVCRGVSLHWGVAVWKVRLAAALLALVMGAGIVAYVFLWIFVPAGDPRALAAQGPADSAPLARGLADESSGSDTVTGQPEGLLETIRLAPRPAVLAGAGVLLLTVSLLMTASGIDGRLIAPILLSLVAIGVSWLRVGADGDQRTGTLVAGAGLLLLAWFVYAFSFYDARQALGISMMGVVLVAAVAVIATPWVNALTTRLAAERASKEREEERADMTAHLHDGVLQTLALIQLHADDATSVASLARSQERELREWLYRSRVPSRDSLSAGIKAVAARVEDERRRPIDVVTVGDTKPCERTDALLDAAAEAMVNAAVHGSEPIAVYCEVRDDVIDLFVRDHGGGFDPEAIPEGRLGIRESIIGRVKRRGGTVEIVSRPHWGTEVRMHMPLTSDTVEDDE